MEKKEEIIVLCKERKDFPGGLEYFCKFCNKTHRFGRGEGDRQSHCSNQNSPHFGENIILKKDGGFNENN